MFGQPAQQARRRCAPALRKEGDDRAELPGEWSARSHEGGRDLHEIVLVVPFPLQQRLRRAVQADDFTRSSLCVRGEEVELRGVEVGELSMRGDERLFGRRMIGDRREQTRRPRQRAAHRRRDDRRRHRPPARGRELRRAEQLRQPVDGEKRHPDDAPTGSAHRAELSRREPATRRHADRVGRHHNRHRRERIRSLRARDRVAQRLRRGAPVRGRHDGDRHGRIVRRA